MTDFTKLIFEKHEVRKTGKQKDDFIISFAQYANEQGYKTNIEKGSIGSKNIVIGNPETAKAVFTAHYDTCAVLPFPNFITPKKISVYLLYQVLLSIIMLLPAVIVGAVLKHFANDFAFLGFYLVLWLVVFLFMAGPANKHTANDNTSGVTVITDLMAKLPTEHKDDVAFILFDLEEAGMVGSSSYASKHKKMMKEKFLINFDCVSDGKNIIFALRKGAVKYKSMLEESFCSNDLFSVEVSKKGIFYPSDQMMFNCGVGVAALKQTKNGLLYMDRIHTKKDTVYQEENIGFLVDGSVKLVEKIKNNAQFS